MITWQIGVSSYQELERLAEVLRRNGIAADLHHDPTGPAIVTFRDPDNIQWGALRADLKGEASAALTAR